VDVGEDAARWQAAGAPVLPALVVDGVAHSLGHPVQVAALLGLAVETIEDPVRLGRDLDRILEAWLEAVALVPWQALLEPTPSRGRAALELAVNTFVPVRLLPAAFGDGRFPWPGDPTTGAGGDEALRRHELTLESRIAGTDDLLAFAEPIRLGWIAFLGESEDELRGAPDRPIVTPAGTLPYAGVLDAQRLHAAQHLRQVTTHLAAAGLPVIDFRPERLPGLRLPARIY
jgi:hypothetical protein